MDIKVLAVEIEKIQEHPQADALEIVFVGGWQVVARKGRHKKGDIVIHIPPEAMVPWDIAEKWGVAKYLSGYDKKFQQGHKYEKSGRVKSLKIRGEISHGFIVQNEDNLPLNEDASEFYGIEKYEEPEELEVGLIARKHPYIFTYTDIQHINNFKRAITAGENIVATEKIHGTNSVVVLAPVDGNPEMDRELLIASKRFRRRIGENSIYEKPILLYPQIEEMLNCLYDHNIVHIYGEIYGNQIQKGYPYNTNLVDYVAFDISINGKFLNYDEFKEITDNFGIPTAPEIYRGPFDFDHLKFLAKGLSVLAGGKHIREGIVIRPEKEKIDPKLGRVILKLVSDEFNLKRDKNRDELNG